MKICQKLLAVIMLISLVFVMSGCTVIKVTFGKEYRLIDNFLDQLDADIRYTLEDFLSKSDHTPATKASLEVVLTEMSASIKAARSDLKARVDDIDSVLNELDYRGSTADWIELQLAQVRANISKQLEDASGGTVVLLSTTVQRGLFGSIWYFIRNHWFISLLIFGGISALVEKIQDSIKPSKPKPQTDGDSTDEL